MFSEPEALRKLSQFSNIELKMYRVQNGPGFHTKGYLFKDKEFYKIIVGSSNMTLSALTVNHEWNTRIVSTSNGEMAYEILNEFESLWNTLMLKTENLIHRLMFILLHILQPHQHRFSAESCTYINVDPCVGLDYLAFVFVAE